MRAPALALALALLAAACAAPATQPSPTGPTATPPDADRTRPGDMTSPPPGAPRPAYWSIPLVDVRTGETFTLGQFEGQVAIVQGMAVW